MNGEIVFEINTLLLLLLLSRISRVRLCEVAVMSDSATPWTAAYQAPPSMDFLGESTGVGCHCLLHNYICCC